MLSFNIDRERIGRVGKVAADGANNDKVDVVIAGRTSQAEGVGGDHGRPNVERGGCFGGPIHVSSFNQFKQWRRGVILGQTSGIEDTFWQSG